MVNEETLAFFSDCEDKRQDKNITCLHINPCRLLRNGPLCHGSIIPSTKVPSYSFTKFKCKEATQTQI